MIVSWYFLSQGLILGMLWAYEELGWGGYWGWDPVENAGFLPWLTATAFLHSIMIQERRGMMKVWNVSLVIVTFLLTMLGTFMTRSGIVQSVHAFGQDTELAIIFMTFISAVAIFSFGYVIYRLPRLRARNELDSWLSREFSFLINNWILLGCAFFILVATLFPTISEWVTGERITVGPPFFNKWMAPPGLTLLFLTGVGPLIAWRKASSENLKTQFALPVSAFVVTAIALNLVPSLRGSMSLGRVKLPMSSMVLCFGLCAFTLTTILQEFYRGTRVRQSHTKLDFFTSLIGLVGRAKQRYGGYLVHLAVVLMFIGFAGDGYKREGDYTVEKGQSVSLGQYTLRYDGVEQTSAPDRDMLTATLTVTVDGKPYTVLHPAKWSYRRHEDEPPTSEVDIHKTAREDLYTVLNGVDGQAGIANIKVVINPLVNWIWIGFLLLAMGTVLAFLPDRAYALAAAAAKSDKSKAAVVASLIAFMLVGAPARAQVLPPTTQPAMERASGDLHMPRNDAERKLMSEFKCICGCPHGLQECGDECGFAPQRRLEVQQMLDAGKSADDVRAFELGKYGQEALRVPLDRGFNRLAWLLPVGALLGAVGVLVVVARKWTRKPAVVATVAAADEPASKAGDPDYESRLDDELDELD
jgi:cytochrome c-type biogenesis protein CcmF